MVKLYINGQLAVLSDDFKATITEENAFLTDQGEYATNIILSLLIPSNANLYKNMNRPNGKGVKQGSRTARLDVEGKTIMNGTELIINNTESEVEIQIVSGLTDVYYLIGENQKLREMDLGICEGFRYNSGSDFQQEVRSHLTKRYPAVSWQPLPFEREDSSQIANDFHLRTSDDGKLVPIYEGTSADVIPQPYLCFIIDRVFERLGYVMSSNSIANTHPYSEACIIHGVETMEYAKMLPEWTVREFLSEIEFFFGCTFIIDSATKTAKIDFQYNVDGGSTIDTTKMVDLEVVDEYKRTPDEENRLRPQNANVGYKLDDDEYYKFACLPHELKSRKLMFYDKSFEELHEYIFNLNAEEKKELQRCFIMLSANTNNTYILYMTNTFTLKKVNYLEGLYNNMESEDIDREVKIVPAAMRDITKFINNGGYGGYFIQYPVSGIADYPNEKEVYTIQEVIEGEENKDSLGYETMRLAIYAGMHQVDWVPSNNTPNTKAVFPISYIEDEAEYGDGRNAYEFEWAHFDKNGVNPFRLSHINTTIYSKIMKVDTTQEHVFRFQRAKDFNIRSVFNIRNREYLCAKIETELSPDGYDVLSTGYFYPRVPNR